MSGAADRRRLIEEPLYEALRLPEPDRVKSARVLVVDDIFTTGTSMNVVAREPEDAGATQFTGLVLARAPWRGGAERRASARRGQSAPFELLPPDET